MIKYRLRFSRSGARPGSPISDKLPADAKAAHLRTTLTLDSKGELGKKLLKGLKQACVMNPVIFKITLVSSISTEERKRLDLRCLTEPAGPHCHGGSQGL